eukprot:747771_1
MNNTIIWVDCSPKVAKQATEIINAGYELQYFNETQDCIDYIQKYLKQKRIVGVITSMMESGGRKQKGLRNGTAMITYIKTNLVPSMLCNPVFAICSASVNKHECMIKYGLDIVIKSSDSRNPRKDVQIKLLKQLKSSPIHRIGTYSAYGTPLHLFSAEQLCYHIKEWVVNDIDYKLHRSQTKQIFLNHQVSGAVINVLKRNAKTLVHAQLVSFLTEPTIDIMFNDVDYESWMHLASKPAEEIGATLFDHPLNKLLLRIQNEPINGQRFIESLHHQNVIQEETGWNDDTIHQIQSILFRHHTFTPSEFAQHMKYIFHTKYVTKLSAPMISTMKEMILQHDVSTLHYQIKNAQNIEEFSHCVINMVDELVSKNEEHKYNCNDDAHDHTDLIQVIYEAIAECFIFGDDYDPMCLKLQHWICNKCSNCNINAVISGILTTNVTICTLCGMSQRDQIVLKLRNCDTYMMVNDVHKDQNRKKNAMDGDIDALIERVMGADKSFDLHCPNQNNNNKPCESMLRLAKMLVIYKRWLQRIHQSGAGNDDITQTIKVDVSVHIDNDTFKKVFESSIQAIELISDSAMKTITRLMDENVDHIGDVTAFLNRPRKTFAQTLCKNAKTKMIFGNRLYSAVKQALAKADVNPVDNDTFKQILIEKMKAIQQQTNLLTTMFERNPNDIANITSFIHIQKDEFAKIIHKETNIDASIAGKLYRTIKTSLKQQAHATQFGACRSYTDIEQIIQDYHHILKVHINTENKELIQNVFRFFECVVHNEDDGTVNEQCRSEKRRMCDSNDLDSGDDIWVLKQYYIQNQLDGIHSHLVHSNWKRVLQRLSKKDKNECKEQDDIDMELPKQAPDDNAMHNKGKFMTDLSESDATSKYGFGIDHLYPYLTPKFDSIRDELLLNEMYCLSPSVFQRVVVQAIRCHKIAMDHYQNELICKHYHSQYNLIRNEIIGIRHIFSVMVYTNFSQFCTAFRTTYRITNDESIESVTNQHQQLYYFAKSLYEAIEFFGSYLDPNVPVYHGLNHKMCFAKFTAFFNQPISCTTDPTIAQQFSEGSGIILTLKAATDYLDDPTKTVKYLSVAWLSDYPNEDEKLCYGKYVVFRICNIHSTEANKLQGHSVGLTVLNKLQETIENKDVHWKDTDKYTQLLVRMIKHKLSNDIHVDSTLHSIDYGRSLFDYFCENQTQICIKDYKLLPHSLKTVLFAASSDTMPLSFIPMTQLFSRLKEIVFTELHINEMTVDNTNYLKSVSQLMKSQQTKVMLNKIVFQSQKQRDDKPNAILKHLVDKYSEWSAKYQWEIKYEVDVENTHKLTFLNHNY